MLNLSTTAVGRIFIPLILRKEVVEIANASNAHVFMFGRHISNHWKGTTKDDEKAVERIVWRRSTTCFEPHKLLEAVWVLRRSSVN